MTNNMFTNLVESE